MKNFLTIACISLLALFGCEDPPEPCAECFLAPEVGECDAAFPRYYFDADAGECKEFIWGGCAGVVPFETLADCLLCGCTVN